MVNPGRAPREDSGLHAQVLDLDIADVSTEGDGIARTGRLIVHVPFTIPGERVRARVRRGVGAVATATLVEVLRASPHRVTPRCRHFGPGPADSKPGAATDLTFRPTAVARRGSSAAPCGGCAWQHIAYPEQLRLKTALVERLVRARVPSAPKTGDMIAAREEPWGFRQKAHFIFGPGPERPRPRSLAMGHFARGSRRMIGVTECPVHDPRANTIAFALHDELRRAGVLADAAGRAGALRSIAVRTATGTNEVMTTIVAAHDGDKRLRTVMRKVMGEAPSGASFHLNIHPRDDGFVFGARTRTLAGSDRMREDLRGASYLISPTSFFQTNAAAAAVLVSLVLEAMPATPARVLDLYAGAGLFSIPLALAGHRVTAVESNRQAVADGMASARLNRLSEERCRFITARTEDALAKAPSPDVVVLDPPRDGCAMGVVDAVFGRLRPPLAVYVSCNPEALASDLARLVQLGYSITSLQPVDMFPHTAHIETVAVLTR